MVLKWRLMRELDGSGAQTRLCSITFTFKCKMCYQRHVRPLARDRSVTTAQHKAVLGTSDKRHWLWLQQPASVCSGTLYLFLFHRAEREKGDPFFWRDSTVVCRPESVFPAFPKPFLRQEGGDLCPDSSAPELSTNC